jgi:UDP-GlcNAc:undecaprenyl-phosphate GlcNAc-1-phosphate transferase
MREYGLTVLVAAAVTYLLTPLVRRFAIAVGAEHRGRARDVHTEPVPLLGGIAMYLGLAAGLLVASRLTHLSTVFMGSRVASGLLLAGGLVVVMGFADDRWGLGAITKLAGQVAAGAIVWWSGAVVAWLPWPGGVTLSLTADQQTVLTILVVVVTINAVNFIDGLDGLAAGIVGIGAAAFFLYYYTLTKRLGLDEQTDPALASAILAGVCLGFLPHNFHPARIFMGDTGSMLLGLLLAYAPIASLASLDPKTLTNPSAYSGGTVNRFPEILPLLVPAIIMLIPYADLLLAVVRRTRAGRSPFSADKKHLQHRLLAIGHSHRASVLLMYLWASLFAGTVVLLSIMRTKLLVLGLVTVAGVLVLLLASMPRLRWWNRRGQLRLAANVTGPVPVPGSPVPGSPVPGSPVPSPVPAVLPAAAGVRAPGARSPGAGAPGAGVPGISSPGIGAPPRGRADRGPDLNPGRRADHGTGLNGGRDEGRLGEGGPGTPRPGHPGPGPAGTNWAAPPAPEAWDPRPSGPGWDARPPGSGWDARPAGSSWDARPAGPACDPPPPDQARPAGAAWDAGPAGAAWDTRSAAAAWQARQAARARDAGPAAEPGPARGGPGAPAGGAAPNGASSHGGLSAGSPPAGSPSNGALPDGALPHGDGGWLAHPAPSDPAPQDGGWPAGPAGQEETSQWFPGRPDPGRSDPGRSDPGRSGPGRSDSGRPGSGNSDSGQWFPGRPSAGQQGSGWWDEHPKTADPRGASPRDVASPAAGPQDAGPRSPDPVQAPRPGARRSRPEDRDGHGPGQEGQPPLLPRRFR